MDYAIYLTHELTPGNIKILVVDAVRLNICPKAMVYIVDFI